MTIIVLKEERKSMNAEASTLSPKHSRLKRQPSCVNVNRPWLNGIPSTLKIKDAAADVYRSTAMLNDSRSTLDRSARMLDRSALMLQGLTSKLNPSSKMLNPSRSMV